MTAFPISGLWIEEHQVQLSLFTHLNHGLLLILLELVLQRLNWWRGIKIVHLGGDSTQNGQVQGVLDRQGWECENHSLTRLEEDARGTVETDV